MGRIVVVLILVLNLQANADDSSFGNRISSFWNAVKTKVTSLISRWTEPEDTRAPASAQPAESAASQKVEGANPQQSNAASPSQPTSHGSALQKVAPFETSPHFVAPFKGSSKQEMQNAAQVIKSQNTFSVSKPARTANAQIPRDKFGVPVFALTKNVTKTIKKGKKTVKTTEAVRVVSKIPALDIGEEARVSGNDFKVPEIKILKVDYKKLSVLNSPELWSKKKLQESLGPKLDLAGEPKKIKRKGDEDDIGIVTLAKVQEIAYQLAQEAAVELKPIKEMDEDDLQFIRGLMLYVANDKCHFASGIFYETEKSKKENIRNASKYYLGECQQKMGLFTQSAENLFEVLGSNLPADLKVRAFALLTDFPEGYNIEIGKRFEKYFDESLPVKPEQRAKAAYMIAAAAMRKEAYNTAKRFAEAIPENHAFYIRGQFIVALADYSLGKTKSGLDRLKKLQKLLPNEPVHKDLHALISLNLARMAFQEKQFPEASKYYLAIEKSHPLWITGLIEHAWTQLMIGDNEGAIGNMFSLQSTYLKAVYRPESYIVRTIGYLNLCQYADAYKSLSLLEREYRPWIPKIESFLRNNPKPLNYYTTMVKYLISSSTTEIGGLPYQALREIGRHKDFLNVQELINLKIDEADQYKLIDQVAVKDYERTRTLRNQAAHRLRDIQAQLKLIGAGKKAPKDENQLKMNRANEQHTIDFYDFQLAVFKEASKAYKNMKNSGRKKLTEEREQLASKAGGILKNRLVQIQKDLIKYFDNNEFLRYEVFAGSGENIRYHMAGGDAGGEGEKRLPSTVKPENKELNWDFQGEFWEDEIGHYKSTLKDNCPQRAAVK